MEAIIPKANIKLFCRILSSMLRVGEDLGLIIEHDKLCLVMINNSKSAYFKVDLWVRGFFDRYTLLSHPEDHSRLPGLVECGLPMKYVMNALKSTTMTDQLRISVDPASNLFTVEHQCQFDIVKTFRVPVIETNVLKATYDKEEYPLVLITDPSSMLGVLANFKSGGSSSSSGGGGGHSGANVSGTSEITFRVDHTNGRVTIQSHVDREDAVQIVPSRMKSALNTSMSCNLEDMFEMEGQLKPGIEMTFTIRDFKQFVGMCESSFGEMRIYLHQQGRPIIFSGKTQEDDVTSDMLLATLNVRDDGGSDSAGGPSQHSSTSARSSKPLASQGASAVFDCHEPKLETTTTTTTTISSHNDSAIMSPPLSSPASTHARHSRSYRLHHESPSSDVSAGSRYQVSGSNDDYAHNGHPFSGDMTEERIYVGEAQRYAYPKADTGGHQEQYGEAGFAPDMQVMPPGQQRQESGDDLGGDEDDVPMSKRRRY